MPVRTFRALPLVLVLGAAVGAGCGGGLAESDLRQPEGWDAQVKLPSAVDHDPAANRVEVHLEAKVATLELRPGQLTEVWTYNGTLPGPTLRARVGDEVVVKFKNSLPEPTTIHWHGLRVPASMDGTTHTQPAVAPGETFEYRFTVPDAGTFWYHPHIRSSAQVGAGLYGAFVVEPREGSAEAGFDKALGDELLLVLSDVSLEEDGRLSPADKHGFFGDYFGREGELVLVNGRAMPTVKLRLGVPQRWRIINAARARYFRFTLPGQTIVRVGGAAGLLERPVEISEVVLPPGERAELYVMPRAEAVPQEPVVVTVPLLDANRFRLPSEAEPGELMRVELSAEKAGYGAAKLPERFADIEKVDTTVAFTRQIEFMEKSDPDGAVLGINGKTDGTLSIDAHVNTVEIWELTNTTPYDHPFHLHGFFFQVLDVDGRAPTMTEWRDTVNLVPGRKVRIAIPFDDREGMWMFHCHILDHADLGMMAMVHLHSSH